MAKDPFSNLPPIPSDDRLEPDEVRTPDHVEVSGDVSAGSPPRTLLKNLGKWAVPTIAAALGIWLFLPEDQNATRRAATSASVEVDTARQADETAAMMKNMKEEAAKKPVIAVPVMPGSLPPPSAGQISGAGPVAPQTGGAAIAKRREMNLIIDSQTRLNTMEIRAKARRVKRQAGALDVIVVGQLSSSPAAARKSRARQSASTPVRWWR